MTPFDFHCRTRLIFGPGAAAAVGEHAAALPARRALLVTDPGLVAAGHAATVERHLAAAGLAVTTFSDTHENPTTADADACAAAARAANPDALVALGGGSALDTAKAALFLLAGGGTMHDYRGSGKARGALLPLLALPTTAGTGSEVQSYALIADAATHEKMACGDARATPRLAILDPHVAVTAPRRVRITAGIDALSHALESAVTTRRAALSAALSTAALQHLDRALLPMIGPEPTVEAVGDMLIGAALAGLAIENSMLGAAHAAANPLTARLGVTHGHAVGVMLPHVMRHNAADPATAARYADLARAVGLPPHAEALIARVVEHLCASGLAATLTPLGVAGGAIPDLARAASLQWTGGFNPRPMDEAAFAALYAAAL